MYINFQLEQLMRIIAIHLRKHLFLLLSNLFLILLNLAINKIEKNKKLNQYTSAEIFQMKTLDHLSILIPIQ